MDREFEDRELSREDVVDLISEAWGYVKGEIELNLQEDGWHIMDYREDLGGAFPINHPKFDKPILPSDTDIDIHGICSDMFIYICG